MKGFSAMGKLVTCNDCKFIKSELVEAGEFWGEFTSYFCGKHERFMSGLATISYFEKWRKYVVTPESNAYQCKYFKPTAEKQEAVDTGQLFWYGKIKCATNTSKVATVKHK